MATKRMRILVNHGLMLAFNLAAASCSSEKPTPSPTSVVNYNPGEAGGVVEDTFTAYATVRAIDAKSRHVTLENDEGAKAIFTAPPEVRNFDQLHVGDRVKATLIERLTVFVDKGAQTRAAHAAMIASAPEGAKPGMLVGEVFETVATVDAIDTANRNATLRFVNDLRIKVPIRPGVDLSKYSVGDKVVIRVTARLSLIAQAQ